MNSRLTVIKPSLEDPYKDDLLGRDKSGKVLEQMVSAFSNGCVIALHGKWGSGKTTFVQMWSKSMQQQGYTVLNYNAWEADYIPDPIIGLIAEFKRGTEAKGKKTIEKMTKAAAKISFSMIPEIIAQISKYYTGVDWENIVKDGSKESMRILNQCIDNYAKQKESIEDFKGALTEYVASLQSDKPVIYIIDELDRCNPAFAVKTLERIKHLFNVPKIVFVLSIDREQLGNSIRGYYGSDMIDGDDYLRRFIDVQYNMPTGDIEKLINSALDRFSYSEEMVKKGNGDFSLDYLKRFTTLIYRLKNLSIRQLEKWLLQTRLVMNSRTNGVSSETILFLVYLYIFENGFYMKFKLGEIDDQSALAFFASNFSESLFDTGGVQAYSTYAVIAELIRSRYGNNDDAFVNRVLDNKGEFLIELPSALSEKWLRDSFHAIRYIPPLYSIMNSVEMTNSITL